MVHPPFVQGSDTLAAHTKQACIDIENSVLKVHFFLNILFLSVDRSGSDADGSDGFCWLQHGRGSYDQHS